MNSELCPSPDQLKQLLLGHLDEQQAEPLLRHLGRCAACARTADKLEIEGPLVQAVRQGIPLARSAVQSVQKGLSERLERLGRSPANDDTPSPRSATSPPTDGALPGASAATEAGNFSFLAPAQSADELGRLGSYRVLRVLGRGGMGVVFLAEDVDLQRSVALKVMLPEVADKPAARERFLREARAAAKLEHDHVVTIHQVGEDRGVPYIAMPLLKGASLEDWLRRRNESHPGAPPPLAQVLKLGREIAQGLAAAHAVGLIHRDIKPANVWLDASAGGRVKILDFGLARPAEGAGEQNLTQSGMILGTPAYMAPEQAQGQKVDGRADLFSLGVVLYRLCTGELPFRGHDAMSTLLAIVMSDPAPPEAMRAGVPASLNELVMKLLAKDPEKRPASAGDVVKALRAIENELRAAGPPPPSAPPEQRQSADDPTLAEPPPVPRAAPGGKRGRLVLAGVAAGLVALLAAGIVLFWPTAKGTVRIEVNDDSIEVGFGKDGATVRGADRKHDITLAPGEHGLRIKRGDLEFETDRFVLGKGETVTLKVELLPGKVRVVRDGEVIGEKPLPAPQPPAAAAPRPAVNFALRFDGNDSYVELPPLRLALARLPFTVEAWVRGEKDAGFNPVLAGGNRRLGVTLTWGGRAERSWAFFTFRPDAVALNRFDNPPGPEIPVHLAGVWDGRETRLYVNGKPANATARRERKVDDDVRPRLLIGGSHLGREKGKIVCFAGKIDEVRISRAARYSSEFKPLRRFEPDADTLALYHFDEGQGDVLKDSSGKGHHGKIVGARWVKAD